MRTLTHALCTISAALLIGGCGGGASTSTSSSSGHVSAALAPAPDAPQNRMAIGGGAAASSGQQVPSGKPIPISPAAGRSISYTADLQVRTKNVADSIAQAKWFVTSAGGYIASESDSSDPVTAKLTFKVPSAQYSTVLGQLAGRLGTKISLQQNAEDVTEQVADVDSRVKSAQATLESFRKLLSKANTIGDVLNVEQEISQREADLESLPARQKALGQQTSYATVTVGLESPSSGPGMPTDSGGGFTGGLKAGWHAFTAMFAGLSTALGWLLPFLVLAAALGLPVLTVRRRRAARRPEQVPADKAVGEPAEKAGSTN